MSEFKRTVVRGVAWNVVATVAKQVLSFAIGVILARLLSPEEFGLIGMTVVFTGFLGLFVDQGLGAAIIHRQDLDRSHLDSIFWMNVLVGAALTVLLYFLSGPIAAFYHEPALRPLTIFLSLNFFIGSLSVVQTALIDKDVAFKKHAIINIVSVIASGVVGIALALRGHGVWSLAWQAITMTTVNVLVMWAVNPWRPGPHFSWKAIHDVKSFSLNLLGANIMFYLVRNVDNMLIGRYLSPAALGLYSKAYQLMMLPVTQISWVLSRVMFPALSSIQADAEKVRRVYLRSVQAIALVTFPLMAGLFAVSDSFVLALFGPKWAGMVPVLRIFCLAGLFDSVNTTVGWLFNSQGRTDIQFKWSIFEALSVLGAFAVGLRWGMEGVAWSYLICDFLLWYPTWHLAGGVVGLRWRTMTRNVARPFFYALLMGGAVMGAGAVLPADWPAGLRLLVLVPLGGAVYSALVWLFKIEAFDEILGLFKGRRPVMEA